MTSDFDEMNESAWPSFSGGTPEERRNRDLLVSAMSEEGFRVLRNEWWHFNHESAGRYPIYDWSFEVLSAELSINGRRASVPRS
jgi:D-alanyl-D-alanine dipeptidase